MRFTNARGPTSEKHVQKWGATSLRFGRLTHNRLVRRIVGGCIAPPRARIRTVRTRPRGIRTFARLLERLIDRGSQRRRQAGAHLLRQHGGEPRHERRMARTGYGECPPTMYGANRLRRTSYDGVWREPAQTSREPVQQPSTPLQRPAQVGKHDRGRQITTNARRHLTHQDMTLRGLVRAPPSARPVQRKIRRKCDAARERSPAAWLPQRL